MGVGLSGVAWGDDCQLPSVAEDVKRALQAAELAFVTADGAELSARVEDAQEALTCLNVLLPTPLSARLHRLVGLDASVRGDPVAAKAFAAARSLDPQYVWPPSLVIEWSPVRTEYQAIPLEDGRLETVSPPAEGELWVDGVRTRERPVEWPSVVQLLETNGTPVWSVYLLGGESTPTHTSRNDAPTPVVEPATQTHRSRRPLDPKLPVALGAGATALATVAMVGIASQSRSQYFDLSTPSAELQPLRTRTNTLAIASTITGVATIGLGAALVVAW